MRKTAAFVGIALLAACFFLTVTMSNRPAKTNNPDANQQSSHRNPVDNAAVHSFMANPATQDSRGSMDPVEQAVASGVVLDVSIKKDPSTGVWSRVRLVKTNVQPRSVRVVELWQEDRQQVQLVCSRREMFLADQLIIRSKPSVNEVTLRKKLAAEGMRLENKISDGVFTIRLPEARIDSVPKAMEKLLKHSGLIDGVEADGVGFGSGIPNDPNFSVQWAFNNTGQSQGTAGADVGAVKFWDLLDGAPGVVIAVLDSGLNFTHPDLVGIGWSNPKETAGDHIDNDGNGKIDDVKGWDFVNNDNDPTDDLGHGSNVTGIIAANRNDGVGVTGMVSGARILVCKILNSSSSGTTSNLIAGVTYARLLGVPVMNLSLQNYPYSSTLDIEFTACQSAGITLCICAGNQGVNNDTTPNYPSSYTQPNIIAVENHDRTDVRWSGSFNPSNYGATSVDVFAPGREIYSPILGSGYDYYTGTSQATPFVTAVAAALKYLHPAWTAPDIKNCILQSVVSRPAYNGLCVTGGRLNALNALSNAVRQTPSQDTDGDGYSDLFEYLAGTHLDNQASMPAVKSDQSGGFLRVSVPRVPRSDAHFAIERSSDLASWTISGVTDFSTTTQLMGGISMSGDRGFLRIKAIPTP